LNFKNSIIIGGGLLGEELNHMINENGGNSSILKKIDYENWDLIPEKTDSVFVVAQSPDYKKKSMTKDLLYVNTVLPLQAAIQASEKEVKNFVYFSTGSVYHKSNEPHTENEDFKSSIDNPYVATKFASETLLSSWKESFKRLFIFRPFFMYGSNQNQLQIFPRMVESVKSKKKIQLANDLGLVFNPIHAFDAARFVLHAINDKLGFQIFNLAGAQKVSLKEVVEKISKILETPSEIEVTNSKESIVLGSINKIKDMGFEYKINIDEGIRELVLDERNSKLFTY